MNNPHAVRAKIVVLWVAMLMALSHARADNGFVAIPPGGPAFVGDAPALNLLLMTIPNGWPCDGELTLVLDRPAVDFCATYTGLASPEFSQPPRKASEQKVTYKFRYKSQVNIFTPEELIKLLGFKTEESK